MPLLLLAVSVLLLRLGLRQLNLRHLARHGHRVPQGFETEIDSERLIKARNYTLDLSRVSLVETLLFQALILLFLFGGGLGVYDRLVAELPGGFIVKGLLFFGGLVLAQSLLDLPFNAWRTFVVEQRHGFNTTTVTLWWADLAKGFVLSLVLTGALLAGVLALMVGLPDYWWLPVWGVLAVFMLFILWISPYVIEPLFFKFTPLADASLADGIRQLVQRTGLSVDKILQVDASRRSTHSNAYFTGIGKDKRIVLFDTLLKQMDTAEILAVLAHELGHWKYGHIRKGLIRSLAVAGIGCFALWWCLSQSWVPSLVGLEEGSVYARLMIVVYAGSLVGFVFTPWKSWRSRQQEWQADSYASEITGEPKAMASALIKLSRDNLSNLHPHPLYAWVYYSHPSVVERVSRLHS